jgi:hypothetical protein
LAAHLPVVLLCMHRDRKRPLCPQVPVIGGHAGITILPLLSQATPPVVLEPAAAKKLVERIQDAGTEVGRATAPCPALPPLRPAHRACTSHACRRPTCAAPALAAPDAGHPPPPPAAFCPAGGAGQGGHRQRHAVHGLRRCALWRGLPARAGGRGRRGGVRLRGLAGHRAALLQQQGGGAWRQRAEACPAPRPLHAAACSRGGPGRRGGTPGGGDACSRPASRPQPVPPLPHPPSRPPRHPPRCAWAARAWRSSCHWAP